MAVVMNSYDRLEADMPRCCNSLPKVSILNEGSHLESGQFQCPDDHLLEYFLEQFYLHQLHKDCLIGQIALQKKKRLKMPQRILFHNLKWIACEKDRLTDA